MMKKNIFIISLVLIVLSTNISFSRNLKIGEVLKSLSMKLEFNRKELHNINDDLLAIQQASIGESNIDNLSSIIDNISRARESYLYQLYLIDVKAYVNENKLNEFFFLSIKTLQITKEVIEHCNKVISFSYPFLINKAALHSVDKARKNMLDSVNEIESTIMILNNIIKSKT